MSTKGLDTMEAMITLAKAYPDRMMKIHESAASEGIPEKFLELILLDLKTARLAESQRWAKGGCRLPRKPSKIQPGEVIR